MARGGHTMNTYTEGAVGIRKKGESLRRGREAKGEEEICNKR